MSKSVKLVHWSFDENFILEVFTLKGISTFYINLSYATLLPMNQNTLTKVLKNIIIGGLCIIPFIPLYVANSMFFPFITGKAFAMRIIIEVIFALWIVLMFANKKYVPKFTWLTGAVTALAVVSLVADLVGVNPIRSLWSNFERMEGWVVIAHLWAYFMVLASVVDTRKLWSVLFNVSLVSATITAIYGLFQLFGLADVHQSAARLDASLGNAAYMGVYMLFHVGLAAFMAFDFAKEKNTLKSWLYSGIAVIGGYFVISYLGLMLGLEGSSAAILQYVPVLLYLALLAASVYAWRYPPLVFLFSFIVFQTQTRGTMLGLIGGVLLALALYAIFGKNESKKSRIVAGSVIGAIVLIGVVFWLNKDASFIQKSPVLQRLASISLSASGQARQYVWPMALKGFSERPILGWGQENFNYVFNANYAPQMYGQEQWFDRAHSVFLDWLVASGVVGFIVYISLYVLAIMGIWKSDLSIAKKSVLTGLVVAYTIHNVFVFDNLSSYLMFFVVLGFVNSFREGKPIKWFGTEPVGKDVLEYVIAPIVLVLFVGTFYFVNVRPIQANYALIDALRACQTAPDAATFERVFAKNVYMANQEAREQLLSCAASVIGSSQIPGPTKQAFFTLTKDQIDAQITATPNDARIYVLGGAFYNNIGATDVALPILEKAYELSPKKQSIAFQLATAQMNQGKNDEALALLKETYESDTSYYEAKRAYVVAMVLGGKEVDARKEFPNEIGLFENAQIAETYMSLKQYEKGIALFKKLALVDPKNIETRSAVAEAQYIAGQTWAAVETLKAIQKDFPELKEQIDAAIKQIQQ